MFINISSEEETITLWTQYSSPSDILTQDLQNWRGSPTLNMDNFIINRDFNAHGPAWGYEHSDDRGQVLLKVMFSDRLFVVQEIPYKIAQKRRYKAKNARFNKFNRKLVRSNSMMFNQLEPVTIYEGLGSFIEMLCMF